MSDLTTILRIMGMPRCVQAADTIEALTAENTKLRAACATGWGEPALINTLTAERDALREDAKRYHFLLANCVSENDDGEKCVYYLCDFEHYNDVSASIDAADWK